jgi:hypothetical protein
MVHRESQIPEAVAGAAVRAVEMARLAVQAWLSLETAERRLHSQVHLQLQWLAVTLYIHSLATVQ